MVRVCTERRLPRCVRVHRTGPGTGDLGGIEVRRLCMHLWLVLGDQRRLEKTKSAPSEETRRARTVQYLPNGLVIVRWWGVSR